MLPMFAGRRNGAAPTSGPYAPMGTVGNAGLMAGASALLANDFVTTAWRYVYEPTRRSIEPTLASADISRPRAQYEDEFTYAPNPVAAATGTGMPSCGNALLLTNSIRSENWLSKNDARARARPPQKP